MDATWEAREERAWRAFEAHGPLWPGAAGDLAGIGIESLGDLRGDDPEAILRGIQEMGRSARPPETLHALRRLVALADATARGPSAIQGPRILLRPWRKNDLGLVAGLTNTDPDAMRHFPAAMSREESDAWCRRMRAHEEEYGWWFWVTEAWMGQFHMAIGVVGLLHVTFETPFAPAIEIGWRIAPRFQRQGYAQEAARLSLDHGFAALGLDRIVAFTAPENEASWRLMEKLGLRRAGTFEHTRIPEGHRLRHQVWYEIRREDWRGLPPGGTRVVRRGRTG